MTARPSRLQVSEQRTRTVLEMIGRELRLARRQHSLSQSVVGRASRTSRSKVSRVERGRAPRLTLADASALLGAVGLDLVVRAIPGGDPIRDAGHTALLGTFRSRLHPTLRWATEVPLPIPGDRRAWDALVGGDGWRLGVEAEMRPDDRQALERRLALKRRDGGVDHLLLLLPNTRDNRRFVRANERELQARFPLAGVRAMQLLAAGQAPPGDSLVLL
jgi:transcriptional regulator with XRE-family HTH domain